MKALKTLRLAENAIREVPPSMIAELRALDEMDLTNNDVGEASSRARILGAAVARARGEPPAVDPARDHRQRHAGGAGAPQRQDAAER